MIEKADIQRVKESLAQNKGKRIRLTAKRGRNRDIVRHGFIKETYPALFIVSLDSVSDFADSERTVSFNYTEILTKAIEIYLVDTKQTIQ